MEKSPSGSSHGTGMHSRQLPEKVLSVNFSVSLCSGDVVTGSSKVSRFRICRAWSVDGGVVLLQLTSVLVRQTFRVRRGFLRQFLAFLFRRLAMVRRMSSVELQRLWVPAALVELAPERRGWGSHLWHRAGRGRYCRRPRRS